MITTELRIDGMTCEHCVKHVTEELMALAGVTEVTVDLVADGVSTAVVRSTSALAPAELAEAVDEAGYRLVDATA
ncbi:Copper-transporting P-type ATPase [Austwickia sp. TVS 96-490-7B]|uniref:heavy-metal-associated domain-containing protein n=1 Tax=Austwickia sp. TVS 96-490-7B TaxID=2830843 RepID=UPI001C55C77B|nr:heavy-metal-associated domain-containing protein [Austwickia sp. TVS 96-490-7B]MBW3085226.1 Copper-transporting P-type ATPase [Austwickia sp. TVS 96-490-7B]